MLGNIPEIRRDPLDFLEQSVAQYGDIFEFKLGPHLITFLNDPVLIDEVFRDSKKVFKKTIFYERFKAFMGNGLLTSEGDFWRRQRKLAQPAFHMSQIQIYCDIFVHATQEWIDQKIKSPSKTNLNFSAELMNLTLKAVLSTLFGSELQASYDKIGKAFDVILDHQESKLSELVYIPERIPTPANLKFNRAKAVIDQLIYSIIRSARSEALSNKSENVFLSRLLGAVDDESNEQMNDDQLRDEVATIILAGHETTANLLSWTFYLLSKNPDCKTKIMEEIDSVLQGRPPGMREFSQLKYTLAVLKESLRLYPPAWVVGRTPIVDTTAGGYKLKKGAIVWLCPYITQRDSKYWPESKAFIPERFLENPKLDTEKAYFPFARGPRGCIGENFALVEATIMLSMILQKLDFLPDESKTVVPKSSVTLRPRDGYWGKLIERCLG